MHLTNHKVWQRSCSAAAASRELCGCLCNTAQSLALTQWCVCVCAFYVCDSQQSTYDFMMLSGDTPTQRTAPVSDAAGGIGAEDVYYDSE